MQNCVYPGRDRSSLYAQSVTLISRPACFGGNRIQAAYTDTAQTVRVKDVSAGGTAKHIPSAVPYYMVNNHQPYRFTST